MIVLCCAHCCGQGALQSPQDSRFKPAGIKFDSWSLVTETDESTEYVTGFPSAITSGYTENDRVQLRVILPVDVERPKMVMVLHYWGAPNLKVERALARELNLRGMGAAILTLPFHLSRTPAGAVSGAMAIQPDPAKLVATMSQAVFDVRRGLDFLETRAECGKIIGIYGTSLGAIISSLSYAVDSRLSNAVFLLGGADLAKIIWDSSLTQPIRESLKSKGMTEVTLRESLSDVEPSNYLADKALGQTFVIRAKFDSVIPPVCTDQLISALPKSQVLQIDTGHYGGIAVQGRLIRESAEFFATVAEGKTYSAPLRLVSPTIRIGLMGRSSGAFDVVAGIDILRWDKAGKQYASFLLTPRDPVLWMGSEIVKGLSLGIGLSRKETGIGLFWTTVL